jgi:manganese/iron transport system permease protein
VRELLVDVLVVIIEPWTQPFMQRAFLVGVLAAVSCAVVGCWVVLRGMAFIGDAIAHAVFPGVAIGYVLQANLAVAGAVSGLLTAVVVVLLSRSRRLAEDAVIGVLFAFAFALGIVVVSTRSSYTGDLASFLFGQILGISTTDVVVVGLVGALVVVTTLVTREQLTAVTFDRETAAAAGLNLLRWDLLLYVLVTLALVSALQAVGNVLVLALLVTPAAAARLLTDRLSTMTVLAAAIGAGGALLGLYVSYYADLASGGLIVLVLTAAFACCFAIRTVRERRRIPARAAVPGPYVADPSLPDRDVVRVAERPVP